MKHPAIDIHTHIEFAGTFDILKKRYTEEEIFTRFVVSATGRRSAELNRGIVAGIRDALRDPQKKIRDMDANGIGLSVLSSTPFAFFYEVEDDLSVELARFQNDQLSEMVKKYPDCFAAMATLPLKVPNEALKELDRTITKLGLRGVEIGSHVGKRELGDAAFWPIYKALESLNVPIFIHPHHVAGLDRLQDFYLSNLIGNPLDTTIAAAQLIFSGVLEKYPGLKVILAHGGGQLPYIFGRLEHGYQVRPESKEKVKSSPRTFLKNFYYDTITHSPEALSYLISLMGSDHVLMGTDYPYDMGDLNPVRTVTQQRGISDKDRRKIMQENAIGLFGLTSA
ncbi:MAG: amidohydrolase family protein [Thermodesulfobacteriota bacterium]|nr:amidohydrolase family protein [Thermodesulfobacteriota bacterium]